MSITLYPYKLLTDEMEARVPGGLMPLPGQFLRFEGAPSSYGRITGVRVVRKKKGEGSGKSKVVGCVVRLKLLYGQPDLAPQEVTLLNDVQMAAEVQRLQGPPLAPLAFAPGMTLDAERLGPLTLIEGDDFAGKYEALLTLIEGVQPHKKVLVLDPLGLFEENPSLHYIKAGRDARLSIQAVGHQRFLDAFGELFPGGLRNWALQAVAASWPITQDFISFERLLDWRSVSESPLKSLILQNQQAVLRAGIFAERPNQVVQWSSLIWQRLNVLDLSGLKAPWKSLFYGEVLRMALEEADSGILPVLIHPECYLSEDWLKQVESPDLSLMVLTSPKKPEAIAKAATTRILVNSSSEAIVEGRLTSGLPLLWPLKATPEPTQTPPIEVAEATIADLMATESAVSQPLEPIARPAPAEPEHHAILDQLFANQQTIEQSVLGRTPSPPPTIVEPVYEEPEAFSFEEASEPDVLDYPDASPEIEAEPGITFQPAQSADDDLLAEADNWALDDFDFDLNLDQKPLDSLETLEAPQLEYSSVLGRSDASMESERTPLSDSPAGYPLPVDTPTGPMDLGTMDEAQMDEMVPLYRKEDAQSELFAGYTPGTRVRHEKYGIGVVTKVVPMNDNVVLNITFESVGKRLLDPRLAPLTREPD